MSRFALILFSNSLKILAGLRGTTAKLTNRKQHQEDERHIEDLLSEESFLLCCPSSYDECSPLRWIQKSKFKRGKHATFYPYCKNYQRLKHTWIDRTSVGLKTVSSRLILLLPSLETGNNGHRFLLLFRVSKMLLGSCYLPQVVVYERLPLPCIWGVMGQFINYTSSQSKNFGRPSSTGIAWMPTLTLRLLA